jgi:amino acid transporter
MRIKTGGAYYIISRSLGVETGAAIGLWLYLAQAIGIAFYVTGFAESIALFYPGVLEVVSQKTIGLAVLAVLGVVTLKSADLALKAQFVILGCIVLSLASLFLGHPPDLPPIGPSQVPVERQSFWVVFAVFFPAVTGILSGIGISGDLKDPSRALPLGTLGAVGISYLVYMIIPVFLVHTVPDLRQIVLHPLIFKISRAGPF